jgi:hypothetical protein
MVLSTKEISYINVDNFKILKMSAIFKIRHKIWAVKIQHYPMSSKFDMWVDNDVPNCFPTLKIIYRSVAILKMADILKNFKTQNCSSNGDLSLCLIVCLYDYPFRSNQH